MIHPREARVPPFQRGETALGDGFELCLCRVRDPTVKSDGVLCVRLDLGNDISTADASLRLTPDEARALAASLARWSGWAERAARDGAEP